MCNEKSRNIMMSITTSRFVLMMIGMLLLGLTAVNCGGGGGGGGGRSSGSDTVSGNSITDCYNCHADGLIPRFADETIFTDWRAGAHGNYEGSSYSGNPGYDDFTSSNCATCHDDREDGMLLADYYLETGISFLGTVNRPIVGCESCHGSGETHFGIGPIPYPNPAASICGNCHDDDTHVNDYPESGSIYTNYNASPHKDSIDSEVYAAGSTTDVQPLCSKCHTDEGARMYTEDANYSALYSSQDARFSAAADVADASPVKCNTCHDAHNAGKLLLPASGSESAEYRTCTSCHQNDEDAYHGINNPEYTDTSRTIYDTHFDIDDAGVNVIEGYVIDKSSTRACSVCHNPHNADNTINEEWADSAHGGHILETIDLGTGKAAVTEKPWMEYNFKGSDRQACQRCHTATGFKNLANSPSDYDPVNNDYSYIGTNQKEMLYCWACHTSNVGDLRKPSSYVSPRYLTGTASVTNGLATVTGTGTTWSSSNTPIGSVFKVSGDASTYIVQAVNSATQITLSAVYTGTTAAGVNYYITPYVVSSGRSVDTGNTGSSICASCHSGRQTGEFVKNYPVAIAGKNFGSFNSHYLAEGGIMYRTIGYEFTGQDYSDDVSYVHPNIGTTGGAEGNEGPCVGCHMMNNESHSFEVITGGLGSVTDIKSYTNVCSRCHGNKATLISTLNTRDTQFNAALAALDTQLQSKGIYFCTSYPYFKTAAACGGAFYTAWPNKGTLGAAFNLNLLKNAHAAYVHNREYTRKLIYDSIDFLDDGALNQSVEATLGGSGDAYDYLNGTR